MTKITLNEANRLIEVMPELFPQSDEFELWASVFLHAKGISSLEFEVGADRHLMRFYYQNHRFSLNFDDYSESIWIEPEGELATEFLNELSEIL